MKPYVAPQYNIVYDVNVLIDAVNQQSRSHDVAVQALSLNEGLSIFYSKHTLETTAHELISLGADPNIVEQYLDVLTSSDDYGAEVYVLDNVRVKPYDLVDRHGNPDHEDRTVVSLMDEAENTTKKPTLLVSNDAALRDWCMKNNRPAVRPHDLARKIRQFGDEFQQDMLNYVSRKTFPNGIQDKTTADKKYVRQETSRVSDAVLAERRKRYPELFTTAEPVETNTGYSEPSFG